MTIEEKGLAVFNRLRLSAALIGAHRAGDEPLIVNASEVDALASYLAPLMPGQIKPDSIAASIVAGTTILFGRKLVVID